MRAAASLVRFRIATFPSVSYGNRCTLSCAGSSRARVCMITRYLATVAVGLGALQVSPPGLAALEIAA